MNLCCLFSITAFPIHYFLKYYWGDIFLNTPLSLFSSLSGLSFLLLLLFPGSVILTDLYTANTSITNSFMNYGSLLQYWPPRIRKVCYLVLSDYLILYPPLILSFHLPLWPFQIQRSVFFFFSFLFIYHFSFILYTKLSFPSLLYFHSLPTPTLIYLPPHPLLLHKRSAFYLFIF